MNETDGMSGMDVRGHIARLFIHPVKSCAPIELPQVRLEATGLSMDRAWMLVDPDGMFVTQRELPRMALVRPELLAEALRLRAPGMPLLQVGLVAQGPVREVQVWKDRVLGIDLGDSAARWLSDFLGRPLRLVRFAAGQRRLSSFKWTGGMEAPNEFSDGYPVLLSSEASVSDLNQRLAASGHASVGVERFRANVVLGGIEAFDEDRLEALHIRTDALPI